MKKFIVGLLSFILSVACVFGATSCKKGSDNKLVLGFDAEFPPYGYEENGQYVGFDIEYAKKVCGNLGYELELKPIDWDGKDGLLKSGAIDFIWNGFTYQGRENDYEWTKQYLDNSIVVLVKSDSGIVTFSDLAGKSVAAQSDSSGETALNAEENAELKASFKGGAFALEADYNTACTKLVAGTYDAIVVDVGVAKYLCQSKSGLTILDDAIATETYAVGFLKGNVELCKKISDEMEKVGKDEAFIKGLCEKYGVDYNSFLLK